MTSTEFNKLKEIVDSGIPIYALQENVYLQVCEIEGDYIILEEFGDIHYKNYNLYDFAFMERLSYDGKL